MFWNELLQPQTDVGRLSDMAEQLNTAMIDAQESFRSLLKQNANSTQVLRMYASFLIGTVFSGDKDVFDVCDHFSDALDFLSKVKLIF